MAGGRCSALLAPATLLGRVSAEMASVVERAGCAARLPAGLLRLHRPALGTGSTRGRARAGRAARRRMLGPVTAAWPVGHRSTQAAGLWREGRRWIPAAGAGRPSRRNAGRGRSRRAGRAAHRLADRLRTALARREPRALRRPGTAGGRAHAGPARRDRPRSSGALRAVRAGAPPLDLRLPRRTHHGVGLSRRPLLGSAGRRPPSPRGRCQRAVRGVPGLARSGHAGRGARGRRGALPGPPTTSRARRAPGRHLLMRAPRSIPGPSLDLGGWLSAAALWGASRFSRWSDRALGARIRVAHTGLFGGRHAGYGADHGRGTRRRRARGDRAQLRRHSARRGGGPGRARKPAGLSVSLPASREHSPPAPDLALHLLELAGDGRRSDPRRTRHRSTAGHAMAALALGARPGGRALGHGPAEHAGEARRRWAGLDRRGRIWIVLVRAAVPGSGDSGRTSRYIFSTSDRAMRR